VRFAGLRLAQAVPILLRSHIVRIVKLHKLNYQLDFVILHSNPKPNISLPNLAYFLTDQVYYQLVVIRPVILHSKPNSRFEAFLLQALPILNEHYWPTFWCFESRLQTILASLVRSTIPDIRYRREVKMY
jgi:hypothetical protein